MTASQFVCRACDEFSAWIPRKRARNIEILYIMKWYVRIWSVCPNSNKWWPVYEWRRAVKRDFKLCFCFFGGTFFFLEAKTVNIERLLSYPKKGENILKAIRSFRRHQKRVLQNNAIKLFSYLFIFPFCKIHASAYSLLFILFVDQGAFDLLQSYFFTHLENRVLLQCINDWKEGGCISSPTVRSIS